MAQESGMGQFTQIADDNILKGTTGPGSDLTKQTEIYKEQVKGKLPENEWSSDNTYIDFKSGKQ
jgi:hypothetical protein